MKEISMDELLAALEGYCPAVHCESYLIYKVNYRHGKGVRCYMGEGCAVFLNEFNYRGQHRIECCIHEISAESDWLAAYHRCEAMTAAEMVKYARCERGMFLCRCGEIPEALAGCPGTYRFTGTAGEVSHDLHVRPLTKKDAVPLNALCDPKQLSDDTYYAKKEAHTFHNCFLNWEYADGFVKMLGYEDDDGRLLGAASYGLADEFNLCCVLRDIFVTREGRGRGIGKALVRSALSHAPGREWLYQADIGNNASAALARSLGFAAVGAKLEVI